MSLHIRTKCNVFFPFIAVHIGESEYYISGINPSFASGLFCGGKECLVILGVGGA